jgi:iron complex outermembrane receptor protein
MDLRLAPSRDFSVSGSVAYLDSEFTDFANASALPGTPGTQDLTGQPNTFSPRWSGNVTVDWGTDIGSDGMRLNVNSNLFFTSSQFVGTVNDANPQSRAPAYALLGGRISLDGPNERWTIALFARNLLDKAYRPLSVYQPLGGALGLSNTVFPGSTANRVMAGEPRAFGASATFRF